MRHSTIARSPIALARLHADRVAGGVGAGLQDAAPRLAHDEVQAYEAATERLLAVGAGDELRLVPDAAPEVRVGALMLAGERDDAIELAELRRLDQQRERGRPVAGGVQDAGDDPDVLAERVGVVRLAGLDAGEDPGDDLGRPVAPQRLPVVGVRGALGRSG